MACGVCVWMLLVCLVQAAHARWSRLTEAPGSQRRGGDGYVGFSPPDGGAHGLYGLVPQNPLRQPLVSGGRGVRLPAGATAPRPAPEDGTLDGSLLSSSALTAERRLRNWQDVFGVRQAPGPNVPAAVFTGRSPSGRRKHQSGLFSGSKKMWLVQQPRGFLLGDGVSAPSVSTETLPLPPAPQSRVQRPDASAANALGRSQSGSSGRRVVTDVSAATQPLACAVGRRVSSRRRSGSPDPFRFGSLQGGRPRDDPGQRRPHQSYLFALGGERAEPPPSAASGCERYTQGLSYRRRVVPAETLQNRGASSTPLSSGRPSWSGMGRLVSGGEASYAPTRTHTLPRHLGANAIRRLMAPAEQEEATVPRPRLPDTHAPLQPASHRPQVKWFRLKMLH